MPTSFVPTRAEDAEALVAMRIAAMRPSLMAAGRFDPERARMRFLSSFAPEQCFFIMGAEASEPLGFFSLRRDVDGLTLQHLYLLPEWQGSGRGGQVLQRILACADRLALPVRVGALRGSDANRFYQRHGFVQVDEEQWDIYYVRQPVATTETADPSEDLLQLLAGIPARPGGSAVNDINHLP
ncbi:MAG: GNAT family N-acetyltransferase [Herbaspirillum sp.]|nr:GNAT family N-acetyltransferase [Herbaspirillum sp.]